MTYTAYVLEKNGTYWSRTKAKFLPTPAEGSTFASREEAEALALTSEVPEERQVVEKHPRTGKLKLIGRDIPYCPPALVREIKMEVPLA